MSERYVSLFAGAGGLDLGLMRAGFQPGLISDDNKYACETLRAAVPSSVVLQADVHDLLNSDVLARDASGKKAPCSLVVGAPPLLGHPLAARGVGADDDEPQLLYRFLDAVIQARPTAFIMELLPVLSSPQWEAVAGRMRRTAWDLGYDTVAPVIDAAEYGVAQHKARMFFIGMPRGCKPDATAAFRPSGKTSAGTALNGLPADLRDVPCASQVYPARAPVLRNSAYSGQLLTGTGRVIDLTKVAPVLPAALGSNKTPVVDLMQLEFGATPWIEGYHKHLLDGGAPLEELPPEARMRRLSLRECAALQGFPPHYPLRGTSPARFKLVGSATPPALAEAVGRSVLAGLA